MFKQIHVIALLCCCTLGNSTTSVQDCTDFKFCTNMTSVQFCTYFIFYISRDCTLTDCIKCAAFQKYKATQKNGTALEKLLGLLKSAILTELPFACTSI